MSAPEFDTGVLTHLLDQARAGDSAAYDDLIRRSVGRLERLARSMLRAYPSVGRWTETDDVLQNALVRLLRALQAVKPTSTREYFGLAAEQIRRELLDLARHFTGERGLGHNYESGFHVRGESSIARTDPAAAELEKWTGFHEAVERLPVENREAFMLAFYHGWTQAQIAELFGVDERTARRRWQSACQTLSADLGGDLPIA
jgi:RNA polymerase sigma-70 factor (ECF subfamily)